MGDKLKRTVRELADQRPLTMKRGAFAKSAWRKALGSDENPSELAVMADKNGNKVGEFPGFMGELHNALYDPYSAKKLPDDVIDPTGVKLLGTAQEQAAWGELQAAARCHSLIAAEAVKDLATAVAAATGIDQMSEDDDASQNPDDLQDELEQIEAMPTQDDNPDSDVTKEEKQDALEQIKKAITKANARRKAMGEKLDKSRGTGQIARAVRAAADKAGKMAEAVNALRACGVGEGAGGGESEQITKELVEQAMKLDQFSKIVDMVGRMQHAADMKAEEALSLGRLAPTGIHQNRELTDLLASEWALEDVDPDLWVKRFLDGEMLAVERESPEPKHKGDLLIFVDRSGSMGGERIEWARALALAAIQRAQKDKRRWQVTMYADRHSELRSSSSDKGFEHALKTISINAGGGTNTDWAIHTVVTGTDLGALRDPDVLLITDGEWEDLSDRTRASLAQYKMRLFVVQLEGYLRKIEAANKVWRIDRLDVDNAAQILMDITL